jgi:hypothetical protein
MPTNSNLKKTKVPSTQQFLPIKEIKEGIAVMRDGSIRAVVMVSSVNFALKNQEEKDAIIMSYQSFLNSLGFPVQIIIRSRRLFLDSYLNNLKRILGEQTNELLRLQTAQYIDFINELLEYANIMEKRFFVVVAHYPMVMEKDNPIKKLFGPDTDKERAGFKEQKTELMSKVEQVISGLSSVGMRCAVLNTEELIELYYAVYNPDSSGTEKLSDAENLEAPVIKGGGRSRC